MFPSQDIEVSKSLVFKENIEECHVDSEVQYPIKETFV
jgi:hypothetical protein